MSREPRDRAATMKVTSSSPNTSPYKYQGTLNPKNDPEPDFQRSVTDIAKPDHGLDLLR